jgi:hypothetical protein
MANKGDGYETLEELVQDINDMLTDKGWSHLLRRWLVVGMHHRPELTAQAMQHVLAGLAKETL